MIGPGFRTGDKKLGTAFHFLLSRADNNHKRITVKSMDKICIVRRRQQHHFMEPLWGKGMPIALGESPEENDPMITMPMTPGESKFLPLSASEKGTLRIISGIAIEQPSQEDGRIVFNFRLQTDETLKMIKPEQVCKMLQVSKTFLVKLMRQGRIRSYKFGRLRRFLLSDVIDYLTASEDVLGKASHKNNEPPGFKPEYSN